MLNQDYYLQLRHILIQIEALLAEQQQDPLHYRLMQRALGKLREDFFDDKIFPAIVVPTLAWKALGHQETPALYVLNASHFLFYAFLDLTDDVEDQELQGPLWKQLGEALAINAGTSLLFASQLMLQQLEQHQVPLRLQLELQQLFSQAGWHLTIGQHRDLASWRYPDLSPQEVLTTHRLKTGTSVSLYLHSAAMLAEATPAQQSLFAELGQSLGLMVQIYGDWLDLHAAVSGDLSNGCISLPLAILGQKLSCQEQELFQLSRAQARKDPLAHGIIRHLLEKTQTLHEIHSLIEAQRTKIQGFLQSLQKTGCEIQDLELFIRRFKPLMSTT